MYRKIKRQLRAKEKEKETQITEIGIALGLKLLTKVFLTPMPEDGIVSKYYRPSASFILRL